VFDVELLIAERTAAKSSFKVGPTRPFSDRRCGVAVSSFQKSNPHGFSCLQRRHELLPF
jgi:hypothetical protein